MPVDVRPDELLGAVLGVADLDELLQDPRFQSGSLVLLDMFGQWHEGIEKPPHGG